LDGEPLQIESSDTHTTGWFGYHKGNVSPGEHELTFEFTCAYVDQAKLIGLDAVNLPPTRWPNAAKKWTRKVSAPLKVFTADEPLVKLTTDAKLDPRSGIQVKRCVVQADEANKKKIILEMDIGGTTSMSCDVSITLAGQTIPLGSQWSARSDNGSTTSGGSNLSAIIESLDPVIEYADITLTPAPRHIEHRPEVTEIWGKPITISGVLVERLDLEVPQTDE
jgi:hypothetical protein